MSTPNDPEIRQTISNTAKLLSCFTPFGRFGPNILFCQQLWTHNSANPASVGGGNFVGKLLSEVESDGGFLYQSVLKLFSVCFFSHLLLQQLLPFHQYPPSVDYPWLSAALWLVIKPPLWLVLMCRPFVEMWTLSLWIGPLFLYTLWCSFGSLWYTLVLSFCSVLVSPGSLWCTLLEKSLSPLYDWRFSVAQQSCVESIGNWDGSGWIPLDTSPLPVLVDGLRLK